MFEKPKLNINYNELEPHIDEKTMQIHYEKHHQGYVDKLNASVKDTKFENMEIRELLNSEVPESIKTSIRNNGGGHFNHTLFWEQLTPNSKEKGTIIELIKEQWGSIDNFKTEFKSKAMDIFGSGWCWLIEKEELKIITTANQDTPKEDILLGIDVWEHAYYLKYQNRRVDYLDAIWNVINWEAIDKRHKV